MNGMSTRLIAACSTVAVFVGWLYAKSDGLIVSVEESGTVNYSNTFYKSSGSDDGFIMAIGFMTFILSAVFSVFNRLRLASDKTLRTVYVINYIVFLCIAFLVNLDVSIVNSIKLGDFALLSGLVIVTVPFFFFRKKAAGS